MADARRHAAFCPGTRPSRCTNSWRLAPLSALAVALLAACATTAPPAPTPTESWDARRAQLQQQERFDLQGRVAVAAGQEGFNARLQWKQEGPRSQLAFDGPLGLGGVRVTADDATLSVVTSRGERRDSEAARRELTARLGFEPPLKSLRFWILGVPDPAQPAEETLDAERRLASLRQDGWQIDYGSYSTVSGQWRPSRMTLKRGDVRVRLLVEGWGS